MEQCSRRRPVHCLGHGPQRWNEGEGDPVAGKSGRGGKNSRPQSIKLDEQRGRFQSQAAKEAANDFRRANQLRIILQEKSTRLCAGIQKMAPRPPVGKKTSHLRIAQGREVASTVLFCIIFPQEVLPGNQTGIDRFHPLKSESCLFERRGDLTEALNRFRQINDINRGAAGRCRTGQFFCFNLSALLPLRNQSVRSGQSALPCVAKPPVPQGVRNSRRSPVPFWPRNLYSTFPALGLVAPGANVILVIFTMLFLSFVGAPLRSRIGFPFPSSIVP